MPQLTKIATFILRFSFIQIAFANDVCDFKYLGDYYEKIYSLGGVHYYDLALNIPDTTRNTIGITEIRTLRGENCFEINYIYIDSLGNIKNSYGYIEKDQHLVQITYNGAVRNVIYDTPEKTPCNFTIIEPSGEKIYFNLNGTYEDPELEKIEKFSKYYVRENVRRIASQCIRYKNYKEHQKNVEWLGK